MENLEVLVQFKSGNFKECIQQFLGNSWHIPLYQNNHITVESTNLFLNVVEENNILVCKALENTSKYDILDRFKSLYSSYRSLNTTPTELELNIIHNLLWWFLVKIKSHNIIQLHFKGTFNCVLQCLVKVQKSYNKSLMLGLDLMPCLVESNAVILCQSLNLLLQVPGVVSLQLLSVITLVTLLLLKKPSKLSADFLSSLKNTVDQLKMLRLHIQQFKSNCLEDLYFKFGNSQANSTASLNTREVVMEAFVISVSLLCALNKKFNSALDCLEKIPEGEKSNFTVLASIIKAYCFLHSQQYTEAKICLAYSNAVPLSPICQAHYRLLLGQVLSAQGNHQAALTQFQAALASPPPLSSLAAHLAASQAQVLHLSTLQLNHLKQLVQLLQENSRSEEIGFEGFEDVCLNLLCQQSQVTLSEALYTLSRQSYITGYHLKALSGYQQLLELLKTKSPGESKFLPPTVQILQEVALAHVKANKLEEGETMCRQLMQDHVPLTTASGGKWEAVLYRMDEDIVSSILLSDILAAGDKRKALEQLNRCFNILVESRDQVGEEEQTLLCDWLLSRTLLRKARLSQDNDAAHYFRRALIHVPGDKEVMYHYKQWSLWHPDHQSFDPGDRVCEFSVAEVNNLALRHILACSVSQEEWNALFDQDSSQNVLDTLFEDD